jgi:high-affinity Fe2+/Pb2+ permease
MSKVSEQENSSLLNFRKSRLSGIVIGLIGGLAIAIGLAPLTSFIYNFLSNLLGSFFNLLIVIPCIVIVLGIYWYFKTEETRFKASKIVEQAYINAQEAHRDKPGKTKPVWDMAQLTLEIYFNRNLNQIRWIFWFSIAVMSLGFILIVYGVVVGYQNPQENWIVAAIGGIAGVLTEFIGATFLFVYKSSMQQADRYTEILERMNFVGMAMQMLDNATEGDTNAGDSSKLGSADSLQEAKIEMAKALLGKLQPTSNKE